MQLWLRDCPSSGLSPCTEAIAAPPRPTERLVQSVGEDAGPKDAPLRSLYPPEPSAPAPVGLPPRHSAGTPAQQQDASNNWDWG